MALADVDLSRESAVALETGAEADRRSWTTERYVLIGLSIALIANCACLYQFAPRDGAFVVGEGLFALTGAITFLWQCFLLVRGYPKSGLTPEASVRQFFTNCLQDYFPGTSRDAYVCLLDQAKDAAGFYKGFDAHWRAVHKSINKVAKGAFPGELYVDVSFWVENLAESLASPDRVQYSVSLVVRIYKHTAGKRDRFPAGELRFIDDVSLCRIGERWYLTSPFWSGSLKNDQGTRPQSEQAVVAASHLTGALAKAEPPATALDAGLPAEPCPLCGGKLVLTGGPPVDSSNQALFLVRTVPDSACRCQSCETSLARVERRTVFGILCLLLSVVVGLVVIGVLLYTEAFFMLVKILLPEKGYDGLKFGLGLVIFGLAASFAFAGLKHLGQSVGCTVMTSRLLPPAQGPIELSPRTVYAVCGAILLLILGLFVWASTRR